MTPALLNHMASAAGGEQIGDSPARQGRFVTAREALTITHARYAAGEHVAGRHVHHRHTDAFYILEGEVIFEIGPDAEAITVSAGGFVAAPPGLAHSFRVADGGPARWLTIHAPDGGFAASCAASATASESSGTSPRSPRTAACRRTRPSSAARLERSSLLGFVSRRARTRRHCDDAVPDFFPRRCDGPHPG